MSVAGMRQLADDLDISYVDLINKKTKFYGGSKFLNLSGMDLKSLPDSISEVKDISLLDLSHNQFETIPETVYNLDLTGLNIAENMLKRIPDRLIILNRLRRLSVEGNNICEVDTNIFQMATLNHLNLSHNSLENLILPLNFLNESIFQLNLSYNRLNELPEGLSRLTHLSSLNISYNRISRLPLELRNSKEIIEFYLDGNRFNDYSDILAIPKLEVLHLAYNNLTLDNNLKFQSSLRELSCSIETSAVITTSVLSVIDHVQEITIYLEDKSDLNDTIAKVRALYRLIGSKKKIESDEYLGIIRIRQSRSYL